MKRATPAADPASAKSAYFRALRWLSSRDLSRSQVRERLELAGFTGRAIDEAIERLTGDRTLDDRRTAMAVARTAARVKRQGPRRVEARLLSIGIERDLVRDVVHEIFTDLDEGELLERTLERRLRGRDELLKNPDDRRRIYAYLLRQGFSAAAVAARLSRKSK